MRKYIYVIFLFFAIQYCQETFAQGYVNPIELYERIYNSYMEAYTDEMEKQEEIKKAVKEEREDRINSELKSLSGKALYEKAMQSRDVYSESSPGYLTRYEFNRYIVSSAKKGYGKAYSLIGMWHRKGNGSAGIEKDYESALIFYKLALKAGDGTASAEIRKLNEVIKNSNEGKRILAEWTEEERQERLNFLRLMENMNQTQQMMNNQTPSRQQYNTGSCRYCNGTGKCHLCTSSGQSKACVQNMYGAKCTDKDCIARNHKCRTCNGTHICMYCKGSGKR